MLELLKTYSIAEILVFVVILALAAKQVIEYLDWGKGRIEKKYKEKYSNERHEEDQTTTIDKLVETQAKTQEQIQELADKVNLLVESDKDDIKAWITEKHHYFCYEKGYIDDYNLDCMEKRFKHYQDENGNSFVGDLMNEVRALPKVSQDGKHKN